MPERPADTALLRAVELLMGQFSEQILALLEAHARGDVSPEDFDARIRDLVGTVSPEAVARHPGRLSLVRLAPPASPAPPEPACEPLAPPEPAPVAEEEGGVPGRMDEGFSVDFEPTPGAPLPDLPAESSLPVPDFVASPGAGAVAQDAIPSLASAGEAVLPAAPLAAEPPLPEPAAAGEDRLPGEASAGEAGAAEAAPAILDGVSGYEPLPEFASALPPEPSAPPAPEPAAPLAVSPESVSGRAEPETPAILDGVSGYEPLPEIELDAEMMVAVAPVPAPPAVRPAAPPAEAAVAKDSSRLGSPKPPALEPAPPAPAPRPAAAPPKAKAAAPPPQAQPPRPTLRPPAAAKPAAPATPPPSGKPASAPPAAGKKPVAPAAPAGPPRPAAAPPGPAKAPAPPPRRPAPGGAGSVVVSGRMASDGFKSKDRPAMGFDEQMFGNNGNDQVEVSHETSFVSRQIRRDMQAKSTYRSPGKAALLSALLPGVGDFYLGKVANGVVFYLLFYALLMLLILRGDLVLVPILLGLALVSAGMSWLGAQKHNEAIHRLQDVPSLRLKTRETTFTLGGNTRRRR